MKNIFQAEKMNQWICGQCHFDIKITETIPVSCFCKWNILRYHVLKWKRCAKDQDHATFATCFTTALRQN